MPRDKKVARHKAAETWRNSGALALDLTHCMAYRGPRTLRARAKIAEWLDIGGNIPKAEISRLLGLAR